MPTDSIISEGIFAFAGFVSGLTSSHGRGCIFLRTSALLRTAVPFALRHGQALPVLQALLQQALQRGALLRAQGLRQRRSVRTGAHVVVQEVAAPAQQRDYALLRALLLFHAEVPPALAAQVKPRGQRKAPPPDLGSGAFRPLTKPANAKMPTD